MALKNDVAKRIMEAVQGDQKAIKAVSEALVSGDPAKIRSVVSTVAKVDLTDEEFNAVTEELRSDPQQNAAYLS
jgi:predicted metal-binding transcription factor (methanogenesis marker protein 9)